MRLEICKMFVNDDIVCNIKPQYDVLVLAVILMIYSILSHKTCTICEVDFSLICSYKANIKEEINIT